MVPNHNKHKDQTGKRRRISFITSGHENDQMVYSGTWVCQVDKCKHPNWSSGRRDQCALAIHGRRRWDGAEVCMRVCACAWGGVGSVHAHGSRNSKETGLSKGRGLKNQQTWGG